MRRPPSRRAVTVALVGLCLGAVALYRFGRPLWEPMWLSLRGRRTVGGVIEMLGPAAEARLRPHFERAGVAYPPAAVALLGFKQDATVELWAQGGGGAWTWIRTYPIEAASGTPGPKLREGDRQVPEGLYRIESLNPNSSWHLSMKLDYPNAFDRQMARADGRDNPGGNIFIHGRGGSIGCVDVGNEAIEELFVLVARTGMSSVRVVLAPHDPRGGKPLSRAPSAPPWVADLYDTIRRELALFRKTAG